MIHRNRGVSSPCALKYAFILGRGRSGTTWIGRILSQFAHCSYKYEPFNRGKNAEFSQWLDDIGTANTQELRSRFHSLCERCFHNIDYPPFARKTCRRQSPLLLRLTWQVGSINAAARGLYEWYGRPTFNECANWVLIKQVNFPNEKLDEFVEVLRPRVIAIVRNPFASVDSALRFYQTTGARPRTPATVDRVLELLPSMDTFGLQYSRNELESMSETAFETVRWRIQTEPLVEFAGRYDQAMMISYEDFAAEPEASARSVFKFLGWEYDERVSSFIVRTTKGRKKRLLDRRDQQFSIYRDPQETLRRWCKELSSDQISDIRRVIEGCKLLPLWPEIDG